MGGIKLVLKGGLVSKGVSVRYKEFARSFSNPFGKITKISALEDISFEISPGDIVGLIGKNGAGKSTLLRVIAGLLRPDGGEMIVNGRTILLAGSDPGFFVDSTGRENVIELASAYGVPKEELADFSDSIINFASLGDAIDRNVRGYSSGMRGKLGFGFITALKPEILLIDETLGVGDEEFRKKAQARMKDFVNNSGTVIISTHSLGLARELCNRAILLDSGRLHFEGETEDTLIKYREILL